MLIITKPTYDALDTIPKSKLMNVLRRLKEELDGHMTTDQKEKYEFFRFYLKTYMSQIKEKLDREKQNELLSTIEEDEHEQDES